ncbi:MAG TPA: uroporphyrinogen-III synthase [Rhizomicrobium sp.]|nr:uroporphyrinogen-III synthase [Rhizomicrobium sp.]
MRILVTRPRPDAEATAAKLRALGHEPIVAPLMEMQFLEGAEISLDGVQAILATSANGVRALARRTARRDVPLFAVGAQSARTAREAGFAKVRSADGDGARLAKAAIAWASPRNGHLLHAAGAESKGDLAAALRAAGFSLRTEILYRAVAATALPAAARTALETGSADAVLLYSPRGARAFAELAAGLDCSGSAALCISEAAARPLAGLGFRAIEVAARPDQAALLACLDRLGPRL